MNYATRSDVCPTRHHCLGTEADTFVDADGAIDNGIRTDLDVPADFSTWIDDRGGVNHFPVSLRASAAHRLALSRPN